jgi:pimeloyl-ACP methyl ester carboxylesterase
VVRAADLVRGTPIPAVKTSGPLTIAQIPEGALAAMRAGVPDALRRANESRDRLPDDAKRMRTWNMAQIGPMASGFNPVEIEELAWLRAERAKSEFPLGDLPLIVITRGKPEGNDAAALASLEDRKREHAAIAKMSRRGQHRIAANSGHHVPIDEPELVIGAIRDLIAQVRP